MMYEKEKSDLMSDELYEVTKDYIKLKNTKYAIEITGKWGSGKTHYLLNYLIPQLSNELDEFKICYVSLNGISSLEQLSENISLQIMKKYQKIIKNANKTLKKYGPALGQILKLDKIIELSAQEISNLVDEKSQSQKGIDFSKLIIFFDDLERIGEGLSLNEVMGYINTNFIEHKHTKVIFICNEEKIDKEFNFEKYIGQRFEYRHNSEETLIDFLTSYSESNPFIETNKNNLKSIIYNIFKEKNSSHANINFRTLNFILDRFTILYRKMENSIDFTNISEQAKDNIYYKVFLNILVIGNEFKENFEGMKNIKFDDATIYEKFNIDSLKFSLFSLSKDDDLNKFLSEIKEKYLKKDPKFDSYIEFFPEITNFILKGFITLDNLKEELKDFLTPPIQSDNSEDILYNYNDYSDSQLKEAQNKIITRIKNNELDVTFYPKFLNLFNMLNKLKLVYPEFEDFPKIFKDNCTQSIKSEKYHESILLQDFRYRFDTSEQNLNDIIRQLEDAKEKASIKKFKSALENYFIQLKENESPNNELLGQIANNQYSLFEILVENKDIYLKYFNNKNVLYEFTYFINNPTNISSNNKIYIEKFKDLLSNSKEKIQPEEHFIWTSNYNSLINTLNSLLEE